MLVANLDESIQAHLSGPSVLGCPGEPLEVADLVAGLCSESTSIRIPHRRLLPRRRWVRRAVKGDAALIEERRADGSAGR